MAITTVSIEKTMTTISDSPLVSGKSAQRQFVCCKRQNDREESLQALNVRLKVDDSYHQSVGQLLRDHMPLTSFQNTAKMGRSKSCWTE